MRIEEFKMEREGLVNIGDVVEVTEGELPTSYYYTAEPAIAMSKNYAQRERIKSDHGKVVDIIKNDRGFYLRIEFDE